MNLITLAKAWNHFVKQWTLATAQNGAINIVALLLKTETDSAPQGGEVVGVLTLMGGDVSLYIETLVVRLREVRSDGESTYWATLSEVVVASSIDITPGHFQEYAFRLAVPPKARLSYAVDSTQLAAEADIGWGKKLRKDRSITVTPASETMALDAALQQLGFRPRQPNFVSIAPADSGLVTRSYDPPATLYAQITGATLQAMLTPEHISGHLMLNYTKTSLKEMVRAVMGEGKQFFPLGIPRSVLAGEKGQDEAKILLQNLLNQSLILPDNQANWMLRAASSPSDTGQTLLRATDNTLETHTEELLHPSAPTPPL